MNAHEKELKIPDLKVKIIALNYQSLMDLSRKYNLNIVYRTAKKFNENKYSVDAIIFQKQIDQLKDAGYQIEVLRDLTKVPDGQVSKINRFQDELERLRKNKGGSNE